MQRLFRPAVLALSVAFTAAPLTARAQSAEAPSPSGEASDVEQARKHFGQGLKLYKEADFDAALVQFERAYAVKPNFKVLYNIAQCYFELHQYVEARDALSRYLKDGAGAIEAERRQSVETDLSDLQRRIAHVTLSVNVSGATVYVDGKKVGTTPLSAAIDVNEGQRTVSVETADRGTKQRVLRLAGGEDQSVSLEFAAPVAVTSSSPAPSRDRHTEAASRGLGAGFWLTGGFALALGAGAGATGYLALKNQADRRESLQRFGVTSRELDDAASRAKAFALTTDILAGSAIVCAGIATVLLVTHHDDATQVGIGLGHVSLSHTF